MFKKRKHPIWREKHVVYIYTWSYRSKYQDLDLLIQNKVVKRILVRGGEYKYRESKIMERYIFVHPPDIKCPIIRNKIKTILFLELRF